MERSQYNERYSLPDPSVSGSRSTRYRAKKRAREQDIEQQANVCHTDAVAEPEPEEPLTPVFDALNPDLGTFEQEIDCDQPQLLEVEAVGEEALCTLLSEDEEQSDVIATVSPNSSDLPLYSGASLTVGSSNILIMQYKLRHKLTDESLADLLQLLRLHCPTPNQCLTSVYYFKNHFRDLECSMHFHYFCSSCYQEIGEPQPLRRCPNQLCRSDLTQPRAQSSFIQTPIEPQLQALFHRELSIY